MMPDIKVESERVDDVPVLFKLLCRMGVQQILDRVMAAHGNRQGLSYGWLATTWSSYILSQADHRMNAVEDWVAHHPRSLEQLISERFTVKDFTDDRLAGLLRQLSQDDIWTEFEQDLGQHLLRVYDLSADRVRLDSTAVSVHHDRDGETLFRLGHSKDHRPDLAQFKVMLGTLDPLGLPLVTDVVAGNVADDVLYVPAIDRTRDVLDRRGLLYVGDVKMSALTTRAHLHAGGDCYLVPLSRTEAIWHDLPLWVEPVLSGKQPLEYVYAPDADPDDDPIVVGYERSRIEAVEDDGASLEWNERGLLIHSPVLKQAAWRGPERRLKKAHTKLLDLTLSPKQGRKQWSDKVALEQAVETILAKHRVAGLLQVTYHREEKTRTIRKYGNRPERTEKQIRYVIDVSENPTAIQDVSKCFGWRLYVTNATKEMLSLEQAVLAYRETYLIDQIFRRLKHQPLGIRPLFVKRDDHAKGLTRLLSVALRVLTLTEYQARQKLQASGEELAGLYAGNPTRSTASPTTERLLEAFENTTLTIVHLPDQKTLCHITPLSDLQRRILGLLDLAPIMYDQLAATVYESLLIDSG